MATAEARWLHLADRISARRLTDIFYRLRAFGILAALAVLVVVTSAIQPRFLSGNELNIILGNTNILALLALGEAAVVISRNVDLSVGSTLGLAAFASGSMFGHLHGVPTVLAIVIVFIVGIGVGTACGIVNGALTTLGRVPSLVVTLATLYVFRGIDILIIGGGQVVASSLPNGFFEISLKSVYDVPYLALVVAAVVAVAAFYLRSYRSGRDLYAIGSNPEAARLVGIPIERRVFGAFVVSGALAGVAGVLWASKYGTLDSTAGSGYELTVIAAVVIGGVAIFGGSGSVVGAAVGALLLNTILGALYVVGVSPFWTQAISGMMILLAITLDRLVSLQLTASLRRKRSAHAA
ncbi:MAG TPA: ABC transporter permease [Gaiellaceae bacterium]|jgi:rhamnose transport system permease protein|nr:ABC transporter permease [Gaiellaceae bacterium]